MPSKICSKCSQELPLDAFSPSEGGRRSQCKSCRRTVQRPAVDEGFEVVQTGTEVHEDGTTGDQWIRARPERATHAGIIEVKPHAHVIKGVSTLVDQSGQVVQQWIKTRVGDAERFQGLLDALASVSEAWTGPNAAAPSVAPTQALDSDLLAVYPLGDPHFGMFAWGAETGEAFDLTIAEERTIAAIDQLVLAAPPAEEAIICSVGDTSHGDNQSNQTARSGHSLDVDTRWGKVMRVIIRSLRRATDLSLTKHARARVIIVPGNHDDHSAVMIALCLAQFYERDPRVTVDTSPDPFLWHRFGRCLLGFVHGHMTKINDLPEIMACDRPRDWAETEHRHWYTGHVHHDRHKDFRGCSVETLRTLAPKDSWHHSKGYRSMQDAKCDIWHRRWGRIQRNVVSISQIKELK